MQPLLGLDWGTTSLRGARLGERGQVLEERSFPRGILSVAPGQFAAVFESLFGDWMTADSLCLISGMAGSQQGWLQAPYCACPAGFAELTTKLAWIAPGRIAIVPGLSIEVDGVPDVMRGEETQVFGALKLLALDSARLVLPGTHSKWVSVQNGRITQFSSSMTGEVYALLRQHSILARSMVEPESDRNNGPAFERGVHQALTGKGLLHTAFSARTLALFERIDQAALPSYLSGLVIGEEIKMQGLSAGDALVLIGAPLLCALYKTALQLVGVSVTQVGNQATWAGLHALAQTLQTQAAKNK
ncbi:putative 2-dehydro-3-deoxygalactonokinase DgoK1 [Polaromonas vacuolata]|uniref:Putative 2-dehydro-3-deoxygalactonokinase DgoK1 n=1 Tax=Polaromonas vacuolata TaxID=37448 RepID=A0A6H2HC60_9BURK|nr:2-dehydro-3-deoxygalactonokinase [Polaromonas vacuolata]QJC57184.1 putative 2-dehydro-3-deoxygalactonokinase DgoK1 [Polaromonas vacuolata]